MTDQGVTTGLKLWLFFFLGFFLLGYSIPLSLCLGAIGGLSGGWVAAWWHGKPSATSAAVPIATPSDQPGALTRMRGRWRKWREERRFKPFRPSPSVYKKRRRSGKPNR